MKRVIFVNILILLTFAGISYWSEEKERLRETLSERAKEQEVLTDSGREQGKSTQEEEEEAQMDPKEEEKPAEAEEPKKDYIKWVDFGVSKFALAEAYEYDRDSYGTKAHISWIDLLAYTAAYTGGDFHNNQTVCQHMDQLKEMIGQGEELSKVVKDLEYFPYYQEAYGAVLGGMVGEYEIEVPTGDKKKPKTWEKRYGLKAFSPIARGFPYNDYDDFGSSRSYGYKRNHLGHDMLGQIGTSICILTRENLKDNL